MNGSQATTGVITSRAEKWNGNKTTVEGQEMMFVSCRYGNNALLSQFAVDGALRVVQFLFVKMELVEQKSHVAQDNASSLLYRSGRQGEKSMEEGKLTTNA
jgi:hypothetical protein